MPCLSPAISSARTTGDRDDASSLTEQIHPHSLLRARDKGNVQSIRSVVFRLEAHTRLSILGHSRFTANRVTGDREWVKRHRETCDQRHARHSRRYSGFLRFGLECRSFVPFFFFPIASLVSGEIGQSFEVEEKPSKFWDPQPFPQAGETCSLCSLNVQKAVQKWGSHSERHRALGMRGRSASRQN